jgi:hypothetical protein
MNYNKKLLGQVDVAPVINTLSNPLTGITTGFDGILVRSDKRCMIGFTTTGVGINSTRWYDVSGNNNHALFTTMPALNQNNGGSATFSTTPTVSTMTFANPLPTQTASTQKWTVSLLTRMRPSSGMQRIAGWNNDIRVAISAGISSTLNYITGAGAEIFTYGSAINNNTWNYVTFTCDIASQTKPTYVNGELSIVAPLNSGDWAQNASGLSATMTVTSWDADVAVFQVYNRALSQAEVRQNSNFFRTRVTGISTAATDYVRDGLVMLLDANNPASLPRETKTFNGIAGTNQGIILQPNRTYDFPINTARQIGLFTTETGANVSFTLYSEEV